MRKAHRLILDALSKKPLTKEELVAQTGYSYDGIRGRISEMRKLGYDIDYELVEEKKYILKHHGKQKLIDLLNKYNLYGQTINLNNVANRLGMSTDEIISAVSKLFSDSNYNVLQLAQDQIKVTRKNS